MIYCAFFASALQSRVAFDFLTIKWYPEFHLLGAASVQNLKFSIRERLNAVVETVCSNGGVSS